MKRKFQVLETRVASLHRVASRFLPRVDVCAPVNKADDRWMTCAQTRSRSSVEHCDEWSRTVGSALSAGMVLFVVLCVVPLLPLTTVYATSCGYRVGRPNANNINKSFQFVLVLWFLKEGLIFFFLIIILNTFFF